MKKRTVAFFLSVLLLTIPLFTACGSGRAPSSAAPASSGAASSAPSAGPVNVPGELKYRTGATSGCFYPVSAAMAEFLPQDIPGLNSVTVVPGQGQSNVQAVQDGQCDIAFAKLPGTIQGLAGVEPFLAPCDKVMNLAYFYTEAFHIVVRADSGINSVSDLKGKSLSTQTVGNQAEQMTREVLEAYGLSYSDLKKVSNVNSYEDSVEQIKDGIVDAFTFANAPPVALLLDLASSRDIKVLSIDEPELQKVLGMNQGYVKQVIPAGSYKDQTEDIVTFGGAVHVIVNADMDEELAYQIVKSTVDHLDAVREAHVVFKNLSVEEMGQQLAVSFHPGAERYFKEAGVLQ